MYRFYIQDALPAGCLPAYSLPKADQPHYYELDESILNAALNIMQITDILDTDDVLDDDCFNRIWLKSELTPAGRQRSITSYISSNCRNRYRHRMKSPPLNRREPMNWRC